MSGESVLVILLVGLIAGWLAGQIVRGRGYGIISDLIIGIIGAFIGDGCCRNSTSTLARALSLRSSTPRSGRCCSCWFSVSFAAEATGEADGAGDGEADWAAVGAGAGSVDW